jgi:hypothetical protein
MITRITSFTIHQTAEGMRATFTYSVIDENGILIKSNVRATVILLDSEILSDVTEIQNYLLDKVPV